MTRHVVSKVLHLRCFTDLLYREPGTNVPEREAQPKALPQTSPPPPKTSACDLHADLAVQSCSHVWRTLLAWRGNKALLEGTFCPFICRAKDLACIPHHYHHRGTMDDSRPTSSHAEKLDDEKLDEEHSSGISASPSRSDGVDAEDIEKNAESQSPPSVEPHRDGQPDADNKEAFLVKWDENESSNPRNWSTPYKGFLTFLLGMLALSASLGSSIIAPAESAMAAELGISEEVAVLAVSLYVLGFAFGPLLWAPVSEVYGRKVSMLPPLLGLALFSIGTATSKSAAAVFITRFFGGVFGSAPVSNVSAALGDMYEPKARGIAVTFYAVCVVGGPTVRASLVYELLK